MTHNEIGVYLSTGSEIAELHLDRCAVTRNQSGVQLQAVDAGGAAILYAGTSAFFDNFYELVTFGSDAGFRLTWSYGNNTGKLTFDGTTPPK